MIYILSWASLMLGAPPSHDLTVGDSFALLNHDVPVVDEPMTTTIRNTSLKGTPLYLWAVAQVLYDAQGKVLFAIESIRDVTNTLGHEEEMHKKLDEIKKLNRLMVDRELVMINLKKEIALLKNEKSS